MADETALTDTDSDGECCSSALMEKVKAAKDKAAQAVKEKALIAQAKVKEGVEKSEECIKLHPWAAISIAAGVGLIAGVLVGALAARRD